VPAGICLHGVFCTASRLSATLGLDHPAGFCRHRPALLPDRGRCHRLLPLPRAPLRLVEAKVLQSLRVVDRRKITPGATAARDGGKVVTKRQFANNPWPQMRFEVNKSETI